MTKTIFEEMGGISISHDRKYIEEVCDKIYQLNPNGLQLIGD